MQRKANVTVAAVIEKDGHFLVAEEKSRGQEVINQPAGHQERGKTLDEAIKLRIEEIKPLGYNQ